MEKQFFRPKEAAVYLGIALSSLWLYAKRGVLKPRKLSEKVTIFDKVDLDRFAGRTAMGVA